MLELWDGTKISDKWVNYSHGFVQTKLVNAQLEHFWCTDKSQGNTNSKDSPQLGLGEAITFPLIVFFVLNHGAITQKSFCPTTTKVGCNLLA